MIGAIVIQIALEGMMTYVYKIHFMQMWKYMIFALIQVLLTTYFCFDLEMMITRRSHIYETSFWYNGFIDL